MTFFVFCMMLLLFCATLLKGEEFNADSITYEWLLDCAQKTSYTDHIPHFQRLFDTMKVRGFLECGCGYSTKYFLDHCENVISIEYLNPGTDERWLIECMQLYRNYSHWVPIAYNLDHSDISFNNACAYACAFHKDYALIDSDYLYSLDRHFKEQISRSERAGIPIDVAFVDAGVYVRGDMVKVLLDNQIPIVVAHDTANDVGEEAEEGLYQWFVVKTPANYEKIYIPYGQGTTFWVKKELEDVIRSLLIYKQTIYNSLL